MNFLHSNNITHRDLKPENIMFNEKDCTVKLIDFGTSKKFVNGVALKEKVGTPYYIAPEILLK